MSVSGYKISVLEGYGFTLAELLIALAILGVIATFTIPKVLNSQADSQRKAVFKEIIATLSELARKRSFQTDQPFADIAEERAFFSDNLNYVKRCTSNTVAEGCWVNGAGGVTGPGNEYGYVLPNGAYIISVNRSGGADDRETLTIDWNGSAPPNTAGEDILTVTLCFGPTSCNTGYRPIIGSGPKVPGAIGPNNTTVAGMYEEIFN